MSCNQDRHLPRRTFLRGVGAADRAAAARRDGAVGHGARADSGAAAHAIRCGLHSQRRNHGIVDAGRRRAGVRVLAILEAARAVSRLAGGDLEPGPGGDAGRRSRGECRRMAHRCRGEAHRGGGHPRRHHDRSGRGRGRSVRTRRSRRWSWRPRTSPATSARAPPATAAPTRTRSRGARRRRRCPWRSIRAPCSSGCSASPGPRRSVRRAGGAIAASSTSSRRRPRGCAAPSAPAIAPGSISISTTSARSSVASSRPRRTTAAVSCRRTRRSASPSRTRSTSV